MDGPKVDLAGKNILVTGGSLGIGRATAELCLQAGANITICARDAGNLEKAARSLQKFGNVSAVAADVSIQSDVKRLFKLVEGIGRLHGVIHAAGIYGPIGMVTSVDPDEWLAAIRINLFGTFLVAQAACRVFMEAGGGRVAFFSGGGAASPFPNYSAYAASKAAVVRLTETLAEEMAPFNIEANCVSPGFVLTRLHQQTLEAGERAGAFYKRTMDVYANGAVPAEVGARAAAFLVSDAARGISGRFVAAPYDDYFSWPDRLESISGSDLFTLRRIVPQDRNLAW